MRRARQRLDCTSLYHFSPTSHPKYYLTHTGMILTYPSVQTFSSGEQTMYRSDAIITLSLAKDNTGSMDLK